MAIAADIILETGALTEEFSGFGAVNNVNLRVRTGTIHALIGPNGAGKTICFNLITKFLQPTAGAIRFKGEDITLRFRHGALSGDLTGLSPPDINNWPHPGRLASRCADEAIGAVRNRKRHDRKEMRALGPTVYFDLEHFPAKWEPVRRRKCDH